MRAASAAGGAVRSESKVQPGFGAPGILHERPPALELRRDHAAVTAVITVVGHVGDVREQTHAAPRRGGTASAATDEDVGKARVHRELGIAAQRAKADARTTIVDDAIAVVVRTGGLRVYLSRVREKRQDGRQI